MTPADKRAYAIAIATGATLWLLAAAIGGRTEAWDSPLYWSAAYPLCVASAGVLGYAHPERPWRWAFAIMLVQPVVLAFSSTGFGLLPLGLILFAMLSLPAVGVAQLGGRLARRRRNA